MRINVRRWATVTGEKHCRDSKTSTRDRPRQSMSRLRKLHSKTSTDKAYRAGSGIANIQTYARSMNERIKYNMPLVVGELDVEELR